MNPEQTKQFLSDINSIKVILLFIQAAITMATLVYILRGK